jgi:raffinose/stachyose/melibiose transport system permease protein
LTSGIARGLFPVGSTVVYALPLYLAVVNVFKSQDDIENSPLSFPFQPTEENLRRVLTRSDHLVWEGLWTSLLVTGSTLALLIFIAPMAAYFIAREDGRFARGLLVFFLFGLMVPPQTILIPIARILDFFGLMFTTPGLVLFNLGYYVPFAIFLYTGFIRSLPRDLDEAAALDGAGRLRTFWAILFPLLRPATASMVIFAGLWIWNDFLNPLIILGPLHGVTITTGIYTALGQFTVDYGQMFAMMFVAAIPVLFVFLLLQRQFIRGLTGGAIKG